MLNDTQQLVYDSTFERIEDKLNFYVNKILKESEPNIRQSSLNALYLTVEMSLSLDKDTKSLLLLENPSPENKDRIEQGIIMNKLRLQQVSQFFFPTQNHQQLKSFFSKLYDFFNGRDANHVMISSITDPRLGIAKPQMIGDILKDDCSKWLDNQLKEKRYSKKTVFAIAKKLKSAGVITELSFKTGAVDTAQLDTDHKDNNSPQTL